MSDNEDYDKTRVAPSRNDEGETRVSDTGSNACNQHEPALAKNDGETVIKPPVSDDAEDGATRSYNREVASNVSAPQGATSPLENIEASPEAESQPTVAMTSRTAGSHFHSGDKLKVGDVLKDRFLLEKKLGEGGMGAVFLAVDQRRVEAQHNNPYVAVKLIHGSLAADSSAFVALQRETDKSQTLAHPNIITVYDFDRDGGIYFMTMEALHGDVLSSKLVATLDRSQAIEYISDLAEGVAYAHHRNIVHSDLKPSNIFLTVDGKLKILDFGIARAIKDTDGGTTVDSSGEVVGLTPSYASCEMFEEKDPHPSDDVYAIGLLAYLLLTGEHPFARQKAIDAREKKLKPQKIKGLKTYQWAAIEKALAFNRDDRWENSEQFLKHFTGSGRRLKQLSLAIVMMAAAFVFYIALFQPEAGPDIPFDQLPSETQQAFISAIEEAELAGKFGDVNGQLYYLDQAYQLHPRNKQVMTALDSAIDPLIERLSTPSDTRERQEFLIQVRELVKYPSLEHNAKVLDLKQDLEK